MTILLYILKNLLLNIQLKKRFLSLLVLLRIKVNKACNLDIKDLLPGIMKQLGPKQFSFIKDYAEQLKNSDKTDKKIDEAPELVENFEDVSKQD